MLIIIASLVVLLLTRIVAADMPYYRFSLNAFHVVMLVGACWSFFSLILIQLTASPTQTGVSLLYFLVFPVALFCGHLMVRMNRAYIERSSVAQLSSANEIELKARFVIEAVTEELRLAAISKVELEMTPETAARHATAIAEASAILDYGTKRFPTAAMYLMRAQYTFCYTKSAGQGLAHIARAEQRSPAADESFTCFYFRKQNEEQFQASEGNVDVLAYLNFQQTLTAARRYDEIATMHQCLFWQELLKQSTDVGRLGAISSDLSDALQVATDAFAKLTRLNGQSVQVLRMHASFLMDVANDVLTGAKMIAKADELEEERVKSHERGEDASNDIFDDTNALISISADLTTLGEIIDVNMGAVRMFGYSRPDLIGANISIIMPAPYAQHHQSQLNHFLETGKSTVLNRSRLVFGVHKSGWLVPVDLFVREVATSEGLTFLGVLRASTASAQGTAVALQRFLSSPEGMAAATTSAGAEAASDQARRQTLAIAASQGAYNIGVHLLFADLAGRVTACTASCSSLVGIALDEVRARSFELVRFAREFGAAESLAAIRSAEGLSTFAQNPTTGARVYVHLMQTLVTVGGDSFYLTHVCERQAPKALGGQLSNSSVDDEDDDDDDAIDVSDDEDEDDNEDDDEDEDDESESDDEDESSEDDDVAAPVATGPVPLSLENLQAHNAALGNKEVPLFDKGNFRKQKGGKHAAAAKKFVADKQKRKMQKSQAAASASAAAAAAAVAKAPKKFGGFSPQVKVGVSAAHADEDDEDEDALVDAIGAAVGGGAVQVDGIELQLKGNSLFSAPTGSLQNAGALKTAPAARKSNLKAVASGVGGKAQSQSSKSSGSNSSRSSASVLHSKLASFARGSGSTEMSAGIANLRLSLFLVLAFVVAIAIIREFVLSGLTDSYVLSVNTLFQAGDRRYLVTRIVLWAHSLLMAELVDANGVYWANFWTAAQVWSGPTSASVFTAWFVSLKSASFFLYLLPHRHRSTPSTRTWSKPMSSASSPSTRCSTMTVARSCRPRTSRSTRSPAWPPTICSATRTTLRCRSRCGTP